MGALTGICTAACVLVMLAGAAPTSAAEPAVLGMRADSLVRLDPMSLAPLPGREVPLAGHTYAWSFAPDRSRVVVASQTELRFVDLGAMRAVGDLEVARRGYVFATAWAGTSRVLAVVLPDGCCGARDTVVVGVDAARRRVLWRQPLGGSAQAGARFRSSLVLVLGPLGRGIGPSRLVVVGPDGRVRSTPLAGIRSGSDWSGSGPDVVGQTWNPGLAVDPAGARAFVVQAGAPVAAVDLRTLRVRYHALSEPVSARLGPSAAAKASEGPTRQALWLGGGILAITGMDRHTSVDDQGREAQWETPAGLKLVDTRSWSAKTIDVRATSAAFAPGTVLAFSLLYDSRAGKASGSGLTGYDLDGTRRFHLLGELRIPPLGVEVDGRHAYVAGALVDVRAGRFVTWVSTGASLLLGDEPIWY